jgi:hypothetical protein
LDPVRLHIHSKISILLLLHHSLLIDGFTRFASLRGHETTGKYICRQTAQLRRDLEPVMDKLPSTIPIEDTFMLLVLGIIDIFDGKAEEGAWRLTVLAGINVRNH